MSTPARGARSVAGPAPVVSAPVVRALVVLALALALALVVLPAPPATGQEPPAVPALTVRLEAVDAVVDDPTDVVSLTLRLDVGAVDATDLRLVTSVHSRVEDPDALDAALDGQPTTVFSSTAQPLPDLRADTATLVEVAVPATDLELGGEGQEGVHPLQLQVFADGDPVGGTTTAVVVLPAARPAPLPATLVVDVVDPAAVPTFDGTVDPSMEAAVAAGSPLVALGRELVDTAADGSAAGTSLTLSGRLLADLADMADGYTRDDGTPIGPDERPARRAATLLDRLRGVLARPDVEALALPYGPADLVALVRGDQATEARRLIASGQDSVAQVTGESPAEGIVVPPDGLDAATLAAIGPEQPEAILLAERYLTFADPGALTPVRRLRTADGGAVIMLVPHDGLSALLRDPDEVGVAALTQVVRAHTALAWMSEGRDRRTAVLLQAPPPDELTPGAVAAVTAAFADSPWLRPVSLDSLAGMVEASDRVVRLAYPPASRAAELPVDYITALAEARQALVPLRALLPASDDLAGEFGRSLLAAAAMPYRDLDQQQRGLDRIQEVLAALGDLSAAVQVIEGPPITLTSAAGEIPVTLVNTAPEPLSVRVRLTSSGFDFDEPVRDLTLPAERAQTLTFQASALTAGGLSSVGVTVEDPSGRLELTTSNLAVRSTAVPVVAVVATIGGCAVLLLWGLREGRRRRNPDQAGRRRGDERAA